MLKYSASLLDSIEKEKAGIDYRCPEGDKKLLSDLLFEINHYAGTDLHYLAELDAFRIPGAGRIVTEYIGRFSSESVKGYLIPALVSDKVQGCDKLPVGSRLERYCYQYDCGLLGDASFYINFMVVFSGDNELNSKYDELLREKPTMVLSDESVSYLVFSGDAASFNGYLDDRVLDGALWRFYIVSIDRESRSMEYTISYIFDGSNRNEHLTDTISRVNELL